MSKTKRAHVSGEPVEVDENETGEPVEVGPEGRRTCPARRGSRGRMRQAVAP